MLFKYILSSSFSISKILYSVSLFSKYFFNIFLYFVLLIILKNSSILLILSSPFKSVNIVFVQIFIFSSYSFFEYNNFIAIFIHLISYLEINKLKICVSFLSKYFTIFSISYIISPFNTFSICSLSASSDNTFKLELLFFNIATALFKLFCFAKSCKSSFFNLLAYIPFNFALILGYFIAEIDIFFTSLVLLMSNTTI